jgi:uncharacterized membrane protein
MKQRIWELDALRGLCILGVMVVHLLFDLIWLYKIVDWTLPEWFLWLQEWGGTVFLLLSGICVTLGSRSIRRGAVVFGCGMLCTAVTWAMSKFGFMSSLLIIRFGVLHCLGLCMLLWPVFRKCSAGALAGVGAVLVVLGLVFAGLTVENPWLFPLGLTTAKFSSGDYFPMLPNLGFFLLGAALGRTVYKKKQSLLPGINSHIAPLRALQFIGRHSLWFYLAHQPVIAGICYLLSLG